MGPDATVLVCSIVEDGYFRFLERLRDDPAIRLAADRVVTFETALERISDDGRIAVLLLLGREQDLRDAVERVRAARPTIHILAVAIENGTANLSLRDPVLDDFQLIVRSLLIGQDRGLKPDTTGKLLKFRARAPEPVAALPPPSDGAGADDAAGLALIEAALDWVEAALRDLTSLWQGEDEDKEPFFLPGFAALERWLSSWSNIGGLHAAQTPFERLQVGLGNEESRTTPLGRIARLLPEPVALKLFLVVLAGEFDMRFDRSFGTLHDDLSRRRPSLGLACAIVAASTNGATPASIRAEVAAMRWLQALGLIEGLGEGGTAPLDQPLHLAGPVIEFLATGREEALAGAPAYPLLRPLPMAAEALVPQPRRARLAAALDAATHASPGAQAFLLGGSERGWLLADAAALAGTGLLLVPPAEANEEELARLPGMALAAERLGGRRLVIDLRGPQEPARRMWRHFAPHLHRLARPALVLWDGLADPTTQGEGAMAPVTLPPPTSDERREAVAAALESAGSADPGLVATLAGGPLASPLLLAKAERMARQLAAQAGRLTPAGEDWARALRHAASRALPALATRVEPRAARRALGEHWIDEVILPDAQHAQLEAVLRHVRNARTVFEDWGYAELVDGRGVTALFAGESGTGKTMAAHMIASDLAADLYAIDLSQLVSKYIGETEKNLDAAFEEAEQAGAVLLFDEADALFGKRSAVSDAHDRYANIEVAYLLQRLQRFTGLAILTTNVPDNIDPAFARRLSFRVDFPRPTAAGRLAIWQQSIPERLRDPALDLTRLAFALDLTGGAIRMVAVHAAMLAADVGGRIGPAEVNAAARSELIRLGHYDLLARLDDIVSPAAQARAA